MLEQREKEAMMAMFDQMADADQVTIYGLIHDRAVANIQMQGKSIDSFLGPLGGAIDKVASSGS